MSKFYKYCLNEASASETTALQESLHCVALGIIQVTGRNVSETDLVTNEKLFDQAFDKYCDVDRSKDEIYNFALNNQGWTKSIANNANALFNSKFLKGKNYTFYRSNGIMKQIYGMFRQLSTKENIKMNDDKWNPGDIWASKIKIIPNFDNLTDYNNFISESLKNGDLVSISLKRSKGMPKVEYVDQGAEGTSVEFKEVQKPRSAFTTGITILTNNPKKSLNVRSFRISSVQPITTEVQIKDSAARHGKKTPSKWIKQYNIPQMSVNDIKNNISDSDDIDQLKRKILLLWKDLGYSFSESQIKKDWSKVEKEYGSKDQYLGYFRSIINALQFGVFLENHKKYASQIINEIIQSASSKSVYSSDFIKVS